MKNTELRNGTEQQKRLYALVEDVSIPVTVIRCDYTQKSHMLYLFTIFHRLNSGGVRLTNQEIRNCIYTGPFNDKLKEFDKKNVEWKAVKKRIWGSMDRFRSIEVLLRVLAFSERRDQYDGNLARFLNEYMHQRTIQVDESTESLDNRLAQVVKRAHDALVVENQRKLPLLLVEALLVAVDVHRHELIAKSKTDLWRLYLEMRERPSFAEGARYAVSSAENVKKRLNDAIEAFSA